MSRATEDLMAQLHGMTVEAMVKALKKANDANEVPSPQLLAQVRQMLKDNGIDAPAKVGGEVDDLAKELQEANVPETEDEYLHH